ncbi:MAG: class I SAM-dependent methyltransferase [Bdellovibrionaceae bacterium]|nr:class I SAM-dependent methyltransferase [Pseudobdellovibrionaceae bacterium]
MSQYSLNIPIYSQGSLPEGSRFFYAESRILPAREEYYLYYDASVDQLAMVKASGQEKPLVVDLVASHREWLRQKLSPKYDLLAKACGGVQGKRILDLTLGLATDSFKLVMWGAQVTGIEKNPMVWALVRDGLIRWRQTQPSFDFELVYGDALAIVETYIKDFDCFYIDPMFHLEKRTALPKKKMQFLSAVVGENRDEDFLPIIKKLIDSKKRVVVKRHPEAESFSGIQVKNVYEGKAVRFDVYHSSL